MRTLGILLLAAIVTAATLGLGCKGEQGPPGEQGPQGEQGSPGPGWGERFLVGRWPRGICSDGENIWVANYGDDTITKLRATDGTNLGTYAAGNTPIDIEDRLFFKFSLQNNYQKMISFRGKVLDHL